MLSSSSIGTTSTGTSSYYEWDFGDGGPVERKYSQLGGTSSPVTNIYGVSGTYYPPRSKKIINLISRLKKTKFIKSTLGGCIVEEKNNFILISRERKIRKMSYQPQK